MLFLKPVLLSAIVTTAMLGNLAAATERPPRVGETRILPNKPAGAKPAAPAKKPVKRRAVRQVLDDDVRPAARSVHIRPMTVPESILPVPGVAPGPVNLNCVGGTCTDASGARYNGGIGTTLISPQGRLCTDNGLTVQCF
ncbi:MAG: hypothetical protein WKG03_11945 [Telluria sp.]